jgi:hypothetical protein
MGAFALPTEIILMITSHLNKPSTISLSLTCRALHSICFPADPILERTEEEELFLLLEKDIPTLYFCHYCTKLHHWHKRWNRSLAWFEETMPCKKRPQDIFQILSIRCIPFWHARLVMNRHLYGPTHGPPLSKLGKRTNNIYRAGGVMKSVSQQASIVDDKLLLMSILSFTSSRDHSVVLRHHIDSYGPMVCMHLAMAKQPTGFLPVRLPELSMDGNRSGFFVPCDQAVGSCPVCLTDYSIGISWQGGKKGHALKVLVYQQLGDCRSPFDPNWRAMLTYWITEVPRAVLPSGHGPGCVRDLWNKGEGIVSRGKSEWVPVPSLDENSFENRSNNRSD